MAACIARRLDHRLGRDARRPPASAVRATLHRAALRPRSPHRHQLAGGCGMGRDYKRYYYLLGSVGRKTPAIARALLRILLKRLPGDGAGTPLVFAIDDSPTKRYGPHVEGTGKHHNPTPGPAGGTERVSGTHPERVSGTHLGFQNSHSGQERQSSVYSGFRPFLDFIDSRKR